MALYLLEQTEVPLRRTRIHHEEWTRLNHRMITKLMKPLSEYFDQLQRSQERIYEIQDNWSSSQFKIHQNQKSAEAKRESNKHQPTIQDQPSDQDQSENSDDIEFMDISAACLDACVFFMKDKELLMVDAGSLCTQSIKNYDRSYQRQEQYGLLPIRVGSEVFWLTKEFQKIKEPKKEIRNNDVYFASKIL